jgi:hypothetical protein
MRIPALIKCAIVLAALSLAIPLIHGQETFDFTIPEPVRPPLAPENPEEIPRQFRGLSLGMSLDDLKAALVRDGMFSFRGDRDVSFLPLREETLIETTGLSFIRRAFFQLSGGSVFMMAFTLDTRLLDHYSVYTSLVRRYGEPDSLNPQEAVWESEDTRLSIERPLTVKYLDKTVFNALIDESRTRESDMLLLREEFLGGF